MIFIKITGSLRRPALGACFNLLKDNDLPDWLAPAGGPFFLVG
jgi:hypothetical protein